METTVKTGAWTTYSTEISKEEMSIFKEAFKGFEGVDYTPLAVATQLVSGMNYRFFCNAKGVYPGANNEAAMVQIYQPSNGIPYITHIHRCE